MVIDTGFGRPWSGETGIGNKDSDRMIEKLGFFSILESKIQIYFLYQQHTKSGSLVINSS